MSQQDITYTIGSVNLVWKSLMVMVKEMVADGTFWEDEDPDGNAKPPGWLFVDVNYKGDEEEEGDEDEVLPTVPSPPPRLQRASVEASGADLCPSPHKNFACATACANTGRRGVRTGLGIFRGGGRV